MKKFGSGIIIFVISFLFSALSYAESSGTGRGKIVATEGHYSPKCRTVRFKSNSTWDVYRFRIDSVDGDDGDINSVALAALIANRDVEIRYDPDITTGCGSDPKLLYITVY